MAAESVDSPEAMQKPLLEIVEDVSTDLTDGGSECGCGDDQCDADGDDAADADVNAVGGVDCEDPTEAAPGQTVAVDAAALEESTVDDASPKGDTKNASRKRSRSRSRAPDGSRLEALSKPRAPPPEPEKETFQPEKKTPKKVQSYRPSLLLRLRPSNLAEAEENFFASGCTEAPRFTYAFDEEVVTKHFEEHSDVCFELLPAAKRIIQKVQDEHGGPEVFFARLYGEETVSAEEMRGIVAEYLKDHNVEEKVEIRVVERMLSTANVVKPGPDGKYIVNIAAAPISKNQVAGICDHEVGTHLLRMMNDESQAWHGCRDRYGLIDPWTTEEGFATLNTYQSHPCKLLYPQALRYMLVCRGAQLGFVELFREVQQHIGDPKRSWQMCCRIKRGMTDTSLPGALYRDQAYFKGAVEILRHLDEVDFGCLYGGQIALQDLDKVHFILRKEVVRLPRFLNSVDKLKAYKAHCRRLIRENQIEAAIERVCKPVFVRTAKEFFKAKPKQSALRATMSFVSESPERKRDAGGTSRSLDVDRLQDLAKPRQVAMLSDVEGDASTSQKRELDRARLQALAVPRCRERAPEQEEDVAMKARRTLDLQHLEHLAKPRQPQIWPSATDTATTSGAEHHRSTSLSRRLQELAAPRQVNASTTLSSMGNADTQGSDDLASTAPRLGYEQDPPPPPPPPPPPAKPRLADATRLSELAAPRKSRCNEEGSDVCACPPVRNRRRGKRSRHRLLALVQERQEEQDIAEKGAQEDEVEDAYTPVLDGPDAQLHAAVVEMTSEVAQSADAELRTASREGSDRKSLGARSRAASRGSLFSNGESVEQQPVAMAPSLGAHGTESLRSQKNVWVERPAAVDAEGPRTSPEADMASGVVVRSQSSLSFVGMAMADTTLATSSSHPKRPSSEARYPNAFFAAATAGTANHQQTATSALLHESRPSRRAVARARSLGTNAVASGGGGSVGVDFPARNADLGAYTRRPRLPVGVPKGACSAVAVAAGTEPPLWKAVPIKLMQLGI